MSWSVQSVQLLNIQRINDINDLITVQNRIVKINIQHNENYQLNSDICIIVSHNVLAYCRDTITKNDRKWYTHKMPENPINVTGMYVEKTLINLSVLILRF